MYEIVKKIAGTVMDTIPNSGGAKIMIEIELSGAPHRIAADWVIQNLIDALALTNKSQAVAIIVRLYRVIGGLTRRWWYRTASM